MSSKILIELRRLLVSTVATRLMIVPYDCSLGCGRKDSPIVLTDAVVRIVSIHRRSSQEKLEDIVAALPSIRPTWCISKLAEEERQITGSLGVQRCRMVVDVSIVGCRVTD
jgi:hypothetical protein